MSFWDTAGKVGETLIRGIASYFEEASRSNSRRDIYTDEQRESFTNFADTMHNVRDYFDDSDD